MSNNKSLEDNVIITLIIIGILLGILFYFINEAKQLSAVFISIALSSLVYRFLGGITNTSFTTGFLKLTGSSAFMLGSIYVLTSLFQQSNTTENYNEDEINKLRDSVKILESNNAILSSKSNSLSKVINGYKKDLGLYYGQWNINKKSRRNSETSIEFLLFTLENNNNLKDDEKINIIKTLVDCAEYINKTNDFDSLIKFIDSPLDKFNRYRYTGRVYYHYADDPLRKLNLSNERQISLWKISLTNFLYAYREKDIDFSEQDKKDLKNAVTKLGYLTRIEFLDDLIDSINDSDIKDFGDYLSNL